MADVEARLTQESAGPDNLPQVAGPTSMAEDVSARNARSDRSDGRKILSLHQGDVMESINPPGLARDGNWEGGE